jgi:Asp-tRNA(Asn)/Glu-tRNA(Gln) amidotransferase C subunit
MNAETKDMPGTMAEIEGVVTAARDAMSEEIIGRVADSAAGAMDLMDQVNRSGLARAIPLLAQMVENGDLQRLVNLARIYGSAEDALTEEMVGRIADAAAAA